MKKISWLAFVLLLSGFLVLMNFKLFEYIYQNLQPHQNEQYFVLFILMYFCALTAFFGLVLLPFITKPLSIIFLFACALSVYFMENYGVIIDHDMINNMMQTDSKEVLDLLNVKLLLYLFGFGIIPSLLILRVQIDFGQTKKHLLTKLATILAPLAIIALLLFAFSQTLVPFFRNYNQVRVYNAPLYQFYSFGKYLKLKFDRPQILQTLSSPIPRNPDKQKLFVLVVGETARAENYSLNGYMTNDTNFYTKAHQVISFDQVFSCGTATAISVPCMFSKSTKANFSTHEYQENVLDLLAKAQIKTLWLENNSGGCKGVCERVQTKVFSQDFDGFLIDEVKNAFDSLAKQNIIILHIQGSHGPAYYKRYPNEFNQFSPTCNTNELQKCSKEAIINTYDNTLLYTDFILSELISLLQSQSQFQSALLYLSDHGESLGENGIYLHGMPYAIAPNSQIHIPMIFWSNDASLMQKAQLKTHARLSHDNLFSVLLGFFELSTPDYDASLDFLGG